MVLLSAPTLTGNEWKYVRECLDSGEISSLGSFIGRFEQMLASVAGTRHAIATSSGTTALHTSLIVAGVSPGDYVILPNLTFVASLNSILYCRAEPVLVDVDPVTWQMDLGLLDRFLETRTALEDGRCVHVETGRTVRAIMPVHVLGNMCDMRKLMAIAERHRLTVIEDASEAIGSYCDGGHSGSFGSIGCFSFNGNKLITTGGGGMIVTNDETIAKRARHIVNQAKVGAEQYYHDEIGYNYRLVNILAALGVAQMEQLDSFLESKREIASWYRSALEKLEGIGFQEALPGVRPNHWLFTFRSKRQPAILSALNNAGLQSRALWVPMKGLPMCESAEYVTDDRVSERLHSECISVPCSSNITREAMGRVVETIRASI